MKKKETINVRIFASFEYETHKTFYHAVSTDEGDSEESEDKHLLTSTDGIIGGFDPFIKWADDRYSSIKELIDVIKFGADEYCLNSFHFFFDYRENFFVSYQDSLNEEGYIYWYGRKLDDQEREDFMRGFLQKIVKDKEHASK